MSTEISYSDGRAVESHILGLLNQATELGSSARIAHESYDQWAVRYHLCPERANLVRHFDFTGLDVLELGAGMGAISRYIAETARSLTVIEGTESRYRALTARLRDLKNWKGIVSNIQDAELSDKFDVVCVIGVLEYSELYVTPDKGESAFSTFLLKARSHLREGGSLIVAIENKLGIKYWSGTEEDHTGSRYDGIVGYPTGKSPRTFSRQELKDLLGWAGFSQIDEYFPFPDYKIPSTVLSATLIERAPALAADLATQHPYFSNGTPRPKSFPDALAVENVASAGLLAEFSNSFLFVASDGQAVPTRTRLLSRQLNSGELAWHYSASRRVPTRTTFSGSKDGIERARDGIQVTKTAAASDASGETTYGSGDFKVRWKAPAPAQVQSGLKLRSRLLRQAYFGEWAGFEADLVRFLETTARTMKSREMAHASTVPLGLDGSALDATFLNAVIAGDAFTLFDLEWSLVGTPMRTSWLVFRNVFLFFNDAEFFGRQAPFKTLHDLYSLCCEKLNIPEDFEADLEKEARFQELVTWQKAEDVRESLRKLFDHPLGRPNLELLAKVLKRIPGVARLARSVLK
jgi:SAM-dependent methyltransferase